MYIDTFLRKVEIRINELLLEAKHHFRTTNFHDNKRNNKMFTPKPIVFDLTGGPMINEDDAENFDMFAPLPNSETGLEHAIEETESKEITELVQDVIKANDVNEEQAKEDTEIEETENSSIVAVDQNKDTDNVESEDTSLMVIQEKVETIIKNNDGLLGFKAIDGVMDEQYCSDLHTIIKLFTRPYSVKRKFEELSNESQTEMAEVKKRMIEEKLQDQERIALLEKTLAEKSSELEKSQGLVGDLYAQLNDTKKEFNSKSEIFEKIKVLVA